MNEGHSALIMAPSPLLLPHLKTALAASNVSTQFSSLSEAEKLVSRDGADADLSNLMPGGCDILVLGDDLFSAKAEPDDALTFGLKICFLSIKFVLRGMMRRRYGRIVCVCPSLGRTSPPSWAVRGALSGLTRSVAREFASRGITANVVDPGHQVANGNAGDTTPFSAESRAQEVANAIAVVAREESGYISAQTLRVDGGVAVLS